MTADIAAAKAALAYLDLDENPISIRAKSRDFFWYSPALKDALDHVVGDFVVTPRNEAEVIEILRVCYAHNVPVTTRGAGTGNYGQAMPLSGGCILHMKAMDNVKEIHPGRVIAEPGCILKDLDAATKAHSGQELRMMSSTYATATIGGFIAGGSGGIGSCKWGALRDLGNIIRLRVVTMEEEPRILEFTGEELARVSHAYGTNGIITEIEMPLAPAYDWTDLFVTFDTFPAAAQFAADLAEQDGILIKVASVFEAPVAHDYFLRVKPHVTPETHLVALAVAPHSMDGFLTFLGRRPEASLLYRSDQENDWKRGPGPIFEYGWNHTTLRALKVDPSITYLQVRYGFPDYMEKIETIRKEFSPEILQHLEVMRESGKVIFAGLTMVKFTTQERLDEIIRRHEEIGALIFNPHRYTLEEGGRQTVDDRQLRFKQEADPKGLLNPGKMISWDDPDWTFDGMYSYPKIQSPA
ncbi:FAD/FMN-containing dehydrogenase [Aliiruegeria haliotis]|uniref:FAD/FMN-containing dehydrogenase n=1 Tax=Aliiruegeria haliotis TaxID=1280846 RepID=A0A2T0RYU1_9RHOB|nr:FAD-binding oxidoreductase [Aliiruegeria haliotis]PRY26359.1 FAD/FMN-containing dehydrogenase [Aliiruegeria haliotis]